MKKVLVISYFYPPLGDVGGFRTVRFVTHMHKYGWDPWVLTVKNPDRHYCTISDRPVPKAIRVTRAVSLFNYSSTLGKINSLLYRIGSIVPRLKPKRPLQQSLYIPDPIPGWLPVAYFCGKGILRGNEFELMYASISPLGGGILAYLLSQKTGVPFVIDARDPVSGRTKLGREPMSLQERVVCKWEDKLVMACENYVVTTKTTEQAYQNAYPNFSHKFRVVYNGFDKVKEVLLPRYSNKFIVIYLGDFYPNDLDPTPFFKAVRNLADENSRFRDEFLFLYLGEKVIWLQEIIDKYRLHGMVSLLGRIKRDRMFTYIRISDLFYVRTQFPTNISAKLFEGLAVKIPVLSTHTHPEVEQLIKKYATDYSILYEESVIEVQSALIKHFYSRTPSPKSLNEQFIQDFSPHSLTKQLCAVFDDAIK